MSDLKLFRIYKFPEKKIEKNIHVVALKLIGIVSPI